MALTISLKPNASVQVGEAIFINRTKRTTKVSIQAPKDVPIKRLKQDDPQGEESPMGVIRDGYGDDTGN